MNDAQHERAAIVAWMRKPNVDQEAELWAKTFADFIEQGDHLRGDDE